MLIQQILVSSIGFMIFYDMFYYLLNKVSITCKYTHWLRSVQIRMREEGDLSFERDFFETFLETTDLPGFPVSGGSTGESALLMPRCQTRVVGLLQAVRKTTVTHITTLASTKVCTVEEHLNAQQV